MNKFGDSPEPEEANDVDGVIIERENLRISIKEQKYFFDLEKLRVIDFNNPEDLNDIQKKVRDIYAAHRPYKYKVKNAEIIDMGVEMPEDDVVESSNMPFSTKVEESQPKVGMKRGRPPSTPRVAQWKRSPNDGLFWDSNSEQYQTVKRQQI